MKVAVLGVGGIGKTHIDNLKAIEGVEIVSICDVSPGAEALAKELGATCFADCSAMLEASPAEVVLICTPTFLHEEQVRAVLEAGKHCICEKPLCLKSAQAKALFALAREKGVLLHVAHVLHFWEEYAILREIVQKGQYGRVVDANFVRLTERPTWSASGWLFDPEKSGVLPFDLHTHDLYYLIGILGRPKIGYIQTEGQPQVLEYLRVCYEFPTATACAEASWYHAPIPFTQRFRVYFEKAVAEFDGDCLMLYAAGEEAKKLGSDSKEVGIETSINVSPTTAYLKELEHFFDCIRRGSPSEIVTEEQVVDTLETLEELVEMAAKGK